MPTEISIGIERGERMSSTLSKQDRQGARTPADLERRHAFGRSFAEVAGIATDARTTAESAKVENADDVVRMINTSAEVIELKSNRLIINSDHFTLTAEGDIEAASGKIAEWDISDKGISKTTETTWVQITPPVLSSDNFISVAIYEDGEVLSTPLSIKANGNIFTKGLIRVSNADDTRVTIIDDGVITIDGPTKQYGDSEQMQKLLMQFYDNGLLYGLYAFGYLDEFGAFDPTGVVVDRIT